MHIIATASVHKVYCCESDVVVTGIRYFVS